MARPGRGSSEEGAPREEPQGPPRDLYATSDIRFVMIEVSKLTERVDNLAATVVKLPGDLERILERHALDVKERIGELKTDVKETRTDVHDIQKSISFVKGVMWVFGGLFTIALVIIGVILKAKLGN